MRWLLLMALALPELAQAAPSGTEVAEAAQFYLEAGGPLERDDCSGLVEAVLARAGTPTRGQVKSFWAEAVRQGRAHQHRVPEVGDLVFWDRTYDANRDGEANDRLTHIGVVVGLEPGGTVVVVHRSSSQGIAELRMNLSHPSEHTDDQGRVLNDYLAKKGYGGPDAPRLAGELWRGFASVSRVAPRPPSLAMSKRELGRTARHVRAGHGLTEAHLVHGDCRDLWYLRNLVFARHGYAFSTPAALEIFEQERWYRSDPAVHRGTVRELLSPADMRNVQLIRGVEQTRLCRI